MQNGQQLAERYISHPCGNIPYTGLRLVFHLRRFSEGFGTQDLVVASQLLKRMSVATHEDEGVSS